MKIYPKILLITLPLIVITALIVGSVAHRVSSRAVWNAVQDVLEYPLSKTMNLCRNEAALIGQAPGPDEVETARKQALETIRSIHFSDTVYVLVIDAQGIILAHPNADMQGSDVSQRSWFKEISHTGAGSTSLILNGRNHWAAYKTFAPWGWHIISTGREDDLAGPITQMGTYTLLLTIFSVLLASVPLFILARRLVAPINTLIQGTDSIRRGDLDTHISIATEDEIGMLAGASNAMTARLRELITNLEDRNLQLQNEIAERRRTEQALRESETKYRAIFDNAVEGIFQSTPSGQLLSVSPSYARIFGFDSPEEMLSTVTDTGKQLYADPGVRETLISRLKSDGQVNDFEFQARRKDGSTSWMALYAKAIRDEHGEFVRLEGFCMDISVQKEAEGERQRLESQLQQAQKMEALGNLTSGIAHDFNNLLQAMSGYVQLLLMKKDPRDADYKYLAEVDRTTGRASDLVKRLLTFSRKMDVKLEEIDLNQVIQDSIKMLDRTIPKMISITTRLDPQLQTIHADPLQLEQILVNLTTNAVDAMPSGGQLVVETQNFSIDREYSRKYLELTSGDYALLTFTDTGKGMAADVRDHIFEPFFTTKEPGKGTGLGLAMVYGIVKGHNGHITCYSEPGRGTTIKIYLPVSQAAPIATDKPHSPTGPVKGGTETILLVDDEKIILEIGEDVLTQNGYTILKASSGEEALEKYTSNTTGIDLILLDLGMPGMGGERCLESLQAINPGVRVIVASGYGAHKIAQKPETFGAAGFLSKPYRLDELLIKVRDILDAPQSGQEKSEGE